MSGYVDLDTGEAFLMDRDTRNQVEEALEQTEDEATSEEALAELCETAPEELIQFARRLVLCDPRVVRVEPYLDRYDDLVEFAASVKDAGVRRALEDALHGQGAFRRFRNVVNGCFRERRQWFDFRDAKKRRWATEWFASHGIEVEWRLPKPVASPHPPPREALLDATLKFAITAAQIPGVKRIALIGSLTRDEPEPKDVDLLVTVDDDLDLAPLAGAARKLSGRAQQLGRGADVFLANGRGDYIGRTCPWRECGPGVRVRCDADHCGRRHYLQDDLRSIRLDSGLVKAPPVDLWPVLTCRVAVPSDVEAHLIKPFLARRPSPPVTGAAE